MKLNKLQEEGLKIAIARYKNTEKFTVISGYAGTGKSTLVRFIIQALNIDENKVAYATFTGKASEVLRKKGNKNAMTLHKLLYDTYPKPNGGFSRVPKISLDYSIIVVDEVSMAPKELIDMLLRHRYIHVIFLGDPGQLPPINKDADNHLLDTPHIFLNEIMRQEEGSGIITLSQKIRNYESIDNFSANDVKIFNRAELSTGMLTWADQIICATNATRKMINNQMREMAGFSGSPQQGDKVICLRNYWDKFSNVEHDPIINGTIGTLENIYESDYLIPYDLKRISGIDKVPMICGSIKTESDIFNDLSMDKNCFEMGVKTLDPKIEYQLNKRKNLPPIPMEVEYGYAITCHKSQGSQWNKVLVIEEGFPFDKNEHARWLYTACTRAASRLVLVR